MSGYVLSPEAEQDIFEIWSYLADEASIDLASQVESELFEAFELLARTPGLGHKRVDLTNIPVFFYRAFPYQHMIVYRKAAPLEVVGVIHAKRKLTRVLNGRRRP